MVHNHELPAITVKNMEGQEVNTVTIPHSGLMILIIWKSSSHQSTSELGTFSGLYDSWKQETGVDIVAVSVDPSSDIGKVVSMVKNKGWTFDCYFDPNRDFARALGINNDPVLFLVDKNNKILWTHNGFSPGDEVMVYYQLQQFYGKEQG